MAANPQSNSHMVLMTLFRYFFNEFCLEQGIPEKLLNTIPLGPFLNWLNGQVVKYTPASLAKAAHVREESVDNFLSNEQGRMAAARYLWPSLVLEQSGCETPIVAITVAELVHFEDGVVLAYQVTAHRQVSGLLNDSFVAMTPKAAAEELAGMVVHSPPGFLHPRSPSMGDLAATAAGINKLIQSSGHTEASKINMLAFVQLFAKLLTYENRPGGGAGAATVGPTTTGPMA